MAAQKQVFKAQAMARDLEVRLKNRIAGITTTAGLDPDRFPTLEVSVGAKSVWIRIRTDGDRSAADGHVDGLGMDQRVYSPHLTEMLREAAATPPAAATNNMIAQVLAELGKNGTKLVVREGTGVEDTTTWATADAAATTTTSTIRSDDINPLTAQQ